MHCRSEGLGSAVLRFENIFIDIIINFSWYICNFNFIDSLNSNTSGIFQVYSCQTPLKGHFYIGQNKNCKQSVKFLRRRDHLLSSDSRLLRYRKWLYYLLLMFSAVFTKYVICITHPYCNHLFYLCYRISYFTPSLFRH